MERKKQKIILLLFLMYGIVSILISFPYSPLANKSFFLKNFFPPSYRMFIKIPKIYPDIEFVFYNNTKDSVRINYTDKLQKELKDKFPFIGNEYYTYKALVFPMHGLDYYKNVNDYKKRYPEKEVNRNGAKLYEDSKKRTQTYKEQLSNISKILRKENSDLNNYKNVKAKLSFNNILPKYDTAYYNKKEYVYSLSDKRIVIEIEE